MKLFKCQHCDLMLFFENRSCERCGHRLGYSPFENELSAVEPAGNMQWRALSVAGNLYKFCANAAFDACNWLISANCAEPFCVACRHNQTVPDLSDQENIENWRKMELAKHRLFYTLLRLNLPLPNRTDDPKRGLAFDFLADISADKKIMTGHDEGVITLALKEADDAEREKRRTDMHEPYRALLGNFRHESGHYYWDRLIADEHREAQCRELFGDDTQDYGESLARYYQNGASANWQEHFISAYATSHPWEDFSETWAHYLHIVDSIETSRAFGMEVHPGVTNDHQLHTAVTIDPYTAPDFQNIIQIWLPLTYAMNAMNRSMGLGDIYPFVLSANVIRKLAFIHDLARAGIRNTAIGSVSERLS